MKDTTARTGTRRLTINSPRTLAVALMFAATTVLAACGGDSGTGPDTKVVPPTPTPVGSYTISTINAKALPVAIFADTGFTYEVTSGSLALSSDGKYTVSITYRQTVPNDVSTFVDSTRGTWVLSGTSVNFTDALDASQSFATWSSTANTLTFTTIEGKATNTYVYSRK